jgi:hypothetical protein
MAFKRAADGIAKKGKTEGKNLGDSGPTAAAQKGKGSKGKGGKTNADMLSMGRGMAKVANQKRG